MIRTVVVEDSVIAQNYFTDLLAKEGDFEILAVCRDAFEAEKICAAGGVDFVLMDVLTLHNHSGLAAGKRIRESGKGTKVLIVTSLVDPEVLTQAKIGAADSLWYKDHGAEDLVGVIRRTLQGERVFPDSAPNISLGAMFSEDLSPRQIQVLRSFVMGYTYDEIAAELGISKRGVRWYMDEIMKMGGFQNRHEMLSAILQNNFIVTTLLDSEK